MSVLDIVDELVVLLEADVTKRDRTAARPVEYDADRLYAWPRNERFMQDGDGSIDQERFAIRVAWGADAQGEIAAGMRMRETSELIQDRVAALAALIRGRRTGATYENAQVDAVDYESLVTSRVRGFLMDVSGYQLIE